MSVPVEANSIFIAEISVTIKFPSISTFPSISRFPSISTFPSISIFPSISTLPLISNEPLISTLLFKLVILSTVKFPQISTSFLK